MRMTRISVAIGAAALLGALACGSDKATGPTTPITCSASDQAALAFCPPSGLALGHSGPANSPTITTTTATTSSVTNSSFAVGGTTSAITNGYWFLITDNTLRSWGVLTVSGTAFFGDIPLFCGAQTILLSFDNASGRAYFMANVTQTGCTVPSFRTQLTWDTDASDIDLHLVRPLGTVESSNDCYYANCSFGGLEWGAVGAAGDPFLDVDDTYGFGPENIVIVSGAETGEYRVVIHNYSSSAGTKPTVKFFWNDVETVRYTSAQTMDSPSRLYWEVARVNIVTHTITSVNTYSSSAP